MTPLLAGYFAEGVQKTPTAAPSKPKPERSWRSSRCALALGAGEAPQPRSGHVTSPRSLKLHHRRLERLVTCHAPGWSVKHGWIERTARPSERSFTSIH